MARGCGVEGVRYFFIKGWNSIISNPHVVLADVATMTAAIACWDLFGSQFLTETEKMAAGTHLGLRLAQSTIAYIGGEVGQMLSGLILSTICWRESADKREEKATCSSYLVERNYLNFTGAEDFFCEGLHAVKANYHTMIVDAFTIAGAIAAWTMFGEIGTLMGTTALWAKLLTTFAGGEFAQILGGIMAAGVFSWKQPDEHGGYMDCEYQSMK